VVRLNNGRGETALFRGSCAGGTPVCEEECRSISESGGGLQGLSTPLIDDSGSGAMKIEPETFGRYALLEKIGQGGMADVFRAKSYGVEGFEKVLVIKRILPKLAREPKFVEMFVREAKLSVRLSHANVVQVFDLGRVGDALFIAMEYVHGLDLATFLSWLRRRNKPIPASVSAYVAAEVAKGLDHAHRRRDEQLRPLGIVHRDVSPQNVLLSYEGEVKVTDFGIAKARDMLGDDEDEGPRTDGKIAIRGKYAYLSPEQANGGATDARCDIWALGVVMYEMIAGTNPFAAPTTFETVRRVRAAEAPPLELARPDVPKEFANIVRRAMTLTPDARYSDAARLHDDLLAFLYTSGERFGAHALSELLLEYRAGRTSESSTHIRAADLEIDVDVEEGLVRTPVEIPDAADVATAPPRAVAGSSHPSGEGGVARAASLGEHREVSAIVLDIPSTIDASRGDQTPAPPTANGVRISDPPLGRATELGESLLTRYGAHIVERDHGRIVALFGLDNPDGRDTDIAVRAAMVLSRALREVSPGASIGIHAGKVVVGADGELLRDERLGSLVVGARELARAREGRVAISSAALRHVRSTVDVEPIPDAARTLASVSGVLVKGRRPASELYAKFVGRREELRVLGEILAAATRRRAKLVTVRGAPGIGKTRLLHEVHRRLQRGAYNVGWYQASCTPHGKDVPLAGVAAMLRVLCGIEEGDPESKVSAVRPRLRALGLNDDDLKTVLDLVRAGGDVGSGDAASTQEHAAAALAHMISRLCDDRLHALAWDDVQSIDEPSLAVLASVAKAVAPCRVVLLFAGLATDGREDGGGVFLHAEPGDSKGVANHLIVLRDLTPEEIRKMLATRLGAREVAPELITFVQERASGNPLFVEELVRAMQDAGAVIKSGETGQEKVAFKRAADAIDLPKSLRGLVSSRFARLSPRQRAILTAVALLGEPAEIEIVATSVESNEHKSEDTGSGVAGVERLLSPLESSGLIRRSGERSISFVSPVAREVVLDAAPIEAKRELHAAIATALIALPNPQNDRIAHHLLEGGDRERAATYFARSGEAHLKSGRPEAAAHDLARAAVLADLRPRPRDEVLGWLRSLVAALGTARGGRAQGAADATTAIDRVLARLEAEEDPRLRRDAWIQAGRAFGAISLFDRAKDAFDRAEQLSQEVHDDRALQSVLMARAEVARRSGEFGEAAKILERVEPMARAHDDSTQLYDVFVGLASAHAAVGGSDGRDRALAYLDSADRVARAIGDTPVLRAERAKTRALIAYFVRDWKLGAECSERAAEQAREAGLTYETAINLHNLGDCRIRLGDNPGGYAALQQSLALAEEGGHDRLVAINRAPIAYLDGLAGDHSAKRRLQDVVVWSNQRGYAWDELNARYWIGLLILHQGDNAGAIEELSRARALAGQLSMRAVVTDCDEALARAR
jgi:serine/threonine protein kinase/tetratricopeptide (TPR) repeat protein